MTTNMLWYTVYKLDIWKWHKTVYRLSILQGQCSSEQIKSYDSKYMLLHSNMSSATCGEKLELNVNNWHVKFKNSCTLKPNKI
jgi:hypothetical protein